MFGGWKRGADVAERLAALEVRLASVAAEVQSALERLRQWEAQEPARLASLHEATDKLRRVTERARKAGELRAERDPSDDASDFWAAWDEYRHGARVPE